MGIEFMNNYQHNIFNMSEVSRINKLHKEAILKETAEEMKQRKAGVKSVYQLKRNAPSYLRKMRSRLDAILNINYTPEAALELIAIRDLLDDINFVPSTDHPADTSAQSGVQS